MYESSYRFVDFSSQAIETFKECGKKDSKMAGTAATNLAFVYFMVCVYFLNLNILPWNVASILKS